MQRNSAATAIERFRCCRAPTENLVDERKQTTGSMRDRLHIHCMPGRRTRYRFQAATTNTPRARPSRSSGHEHGLESAVVQLYRFGKDPAGRRPGLPPEVVGTLSRPWHPFPMGEGMDVTCCGGIGR